MAPSNRNLAARVERLEKATGGPAPSVEPRINLTVLSDLSKPLLGYRASDGEAARDVMRLPGESDNALRARALESGGRKDIVSVIMELREP